MKAITVCVGYDDLLAITLPRNARHFDEVVVVTSNRDQATRAVVEAVPNARCFLTDAFWRAGAAFNKGLALELGLDALGRDGWLCIFDADTLLPPPRLIDHWNKDARCISSPRRRACDDPAKYMVEILTGAWSGFPQVPDGEPAGYCQVFHADDPVLAARPWYGTTWKHAGGCDSDFSARWPRSSWHWLDFEVLHLGPVGENWHGRVTPRLDGTVPDTADQAAAAQRAMVEGRRQAGWRRREQIG
jgi:hypothetical protein